MTTDYGSNLCSDPLRLADDAIGPRNRSRRLAHVEGQHVQFTGKPLHLIGRRRLLDHMRRSTYMKRPQASRLRAQFTTLMI